MKIAITGSRGLIGKSLTNALVLDGHTVLRIVSSIRNVLEDNEVTWTPDQPTRYIEHFQNPDIGPAYRRLLHWSLALKDSLLCCSDASSINRLTRNSREQNL